MARNDPHSYTDQDQARIERILWKAKVDFAAKRLEAEATLLFASRATGTVDLDTRALEILSVTDAENQPVRFTVFPADPILGSRLELAVPPATAAICIRYRTSPEASALQWLQPTQTAGGKHPFLFSQCQAIHARSVLPLQDSPSVRIRFVAEVTVPRELRAVMAAKFLLRKEEGDLAVERYEMPEPIPPYLLAFAVGDLASSELGPRSRVWAEPSVRELAAWEFADVDRMLTVAEKLFGPYEWERFDLLTMPPSFPYGGMENPRLTFLTPTLLARDRSLVNVLAHELAHSWTGNLVSNASAEHFWLNEGFTVFAERRILEALQGPEVSELHAALGRRSLEEALVHFEKAPELTCLRTRLAGVDPDETFSQVPYEKGYLFLRALEEASGRDTFSAFLKRYISTFRFQALTTEEFAAFASRELFEAWRKVRAEVWLYEPGIPAGAPRAKAGRLEGLRAWTRSVPPREVAHTWSPIEWQLYLESVERPVPGGLAQALEAEYQLTRSQNCEILASWLVLAADAGLASTLPRTREFLASVGRMKYLKPLYAALAKQPATRALAQQTFEQCRDSYHPIAQQVVQGLLRRHAA